MSFSYFPGIGPTDDVRLLIGDTDPNAAEDARLENEDIVRLIALHGGLRHSAAAAARALAAKFARKFEGSSGGPAPSRTRAQDLMALANRLESAAAAAAVPFAGGLRQSEKDTASADTDRVQPSFSRGMLDRSEAD